MKHGKRLKKQQKIFLNEHGLNPDNWLACKDTPELMEVVHRDTGEKRTIYKERK